MSTNPVDVTVHHSRFRLATKSHAPLADADENLRRRGKLNDQRIKDRMTSTVFKGKAHYEESVYTSQGPGARAVLLKSELVPEVKGESCVEVSIWNILVVIRCGSGPRINQISPAAPPPDARGNPGPARRTPVTLFSLD